MTRFLICTLLLFTTITGTAQTTTPAPYLDFPVYFDFGADTLSAAARSRLQQLAGNIRGLPGLDLHLTAHTDAVGSARANLALSGRRAAAVGAALTTAGIPDSLIHQERVGERAPVASNDTETGRQRNRRVEIVVFSSLPMRPLNGQVTSRADSTGVPATVFLSTPSWSDSLQTDTTGEFRAFIPAREAVRFDAFAEGFFFDTQILPPDTSAAAVRTTLPLPPARTGVRLPVKRLHFVGGQAVLLRKSLPELDRLLRFLQLNASLHIIIHGHVNVPNAPPVSVESDSYQLSKDRAERIYDYLAERGIAPGRLSRKAHGNWEMLYPKATSAGQQAANRRVEIEVQ